MNNAIDALTEKEKEALRLLLAGHDAKSSAQELDISVHTVNDRLRNARRKGGVSSSREAARILGDAEDAAPQKAVHQDLGSANISPVEDDPEVAKVEVGEKSPTAWQSKGVIIMTTFAVLIAAGAAISFGMPSSENFSSDDVSTTASDNAFEASPPLQRSASEEEAREWLALVDAGDIEGSRAASSESMRERYPEGLWEIGVLLRQNNFGSMVSRRLVSVDKRGAHEAGAVGEFEMLVFEADYARERGVREQVFMRKIEGEWVVVDFTGDPEEGC